MAVAQNSVYAARKGAVVSGGRRYLASLVASGSVLSISKNTRAELDPKLDPLANPNYPNTPPWDVIGGTGWSHVPDYSGAAFATGLGRAGTYLQYAASGHSANGATCWLAFDVETLRWELRGRPLPCNNLFGYVGGSSPPSSQFDHTWGDWIGGSADWGAFAQPGYNPPAGSHTRCSFEYRPPSKAGNATGQVLTAWQETGVQGGTSILGSHVWNGDTGRWSRTNGLKPASGSAAGGVCYHSGLDVLVGFNFVSSQYASTIDFLDCATGLWTRRTGVGGSTPYLRVDAATNIVVGGLMVVFEHAGAGTFAMKGIKVADIVNNTSPSWTTLTLSASAWPVKAGSTDSVRFALCPVDGCFYAVDRVAGSHSLYKLTPPGTTDAANLSGTWQLAAQTLGGEGLHGVTWENSKMQWCDALMAFLRSSEDMSASMQAIRPVGI